MREIIFWVVNAFNVIYHHIKNLNVMRGFGFWEFVFFVYF
jgi:hypothetical protein